MTSMIAFNEIAKFGKKKNCCMLKPGSLMPPVYLRLSRQTACDTAQTYKNITGLCRWCACEAELEYTSQAYQRQIWLDLCCRHLLLFSYGNSIPGTTGSYVVGSLPGKWEPGLISVCDGFFLSWLTSTF